jgi:hypothetical protein
MFFVSSNTFTVKVEFTQGRQNANTTKIMDASFESFIRKINDIR